MSLLTLLTDFGTADSYVGEMKGVLATRAPGVPLVDISHSITPGDIRGACYVLSRAAPRFPPGTVHLAVVDPGVGAARAALALAAQGQFFVGPDNGVFTRVLHHAAATIVTLPVPDGAAPTFHGRDVFAPAAAALATGTALEALGARFTDEPERLATREPWHEGKVLIGEVIHVDRFGTLVTNFTRENLPGYAVLEIEGIEVGRLHRTFGDVAAGAAVAFEGSGGEIEIAVRNGSAARRFGVGVGAKVRGRLG